MIAMIELTGVAMQCESCWELFVSQGAYEVHRVPAIVNDPYFRRCLSAGEMMDRGMSKNAAGQWVVTQIPASIRASQDQNGLVEPVEGD